MRKMFVLKRKKLNLSLILIISLLFTINLFAQPKIKIDNTNVEFGTMNYQKSPLLERVTVRNIGTEKLIITDIRAGCGCTVASLSTRSKEIMPGDTVTLDISFDIRNYSGKITKSVSVFSNDPEKPNITVFLNCNVIRPFEVKPKYISFEKVFVGEPSTVEVNIVNNSSKDAVVKSVTVDNPNLIVNIQKDDVISKSTPFTLKATILATKNGNVRTTISIEIYHPDEEKIDIFTYGNAITRIPQNENEKK